MVKKIIAPFLSLIVFTSIFVSSLYFYQASQEVYQEKDKYIILKKLSDIRGKLENSINSTFLLINGLVSYVSLHPNLTNQEFEIFATELMRPSKHIRNITLAPNNIITYIHPLKGNEAVLGLDLSSHPIQKRTVRKMIEDKKTVIAGPVNLVQGGRAFINRTPIFINDKYWGMASIPINMDSIFKSAGLKSTIGELDFALRGKDGLGEKGEVFFGNAEIFEQKDTQILNILLVNGYWQLAANFNSSYQKNSNSWILITGLILAFVTAFLVFHFISSLFTLSRNSKQMKKYIDIIDETVITSSTDLKGIIIYVSHAFCKISKYTKDELLGKNHNILRDDFISKELYENMWKTITNNQVWEGEIRNKAKDGTFYWVKAKISPVYDEYGEKIGYTSVRQDITDKKIIEEISITDGLTHIYNRRYFNEVFPKMINSAKRNSSSIAFLLLDIDNFKLYNDNYGHQKGDSVLINFAQCLQKSLHRADDYAFRLGGEEFGIIFNAQSKEKAIEFSEKLRLNIEDLKLVHEYNTASTYVTASMGLVYLNANDIESMDEIYKQADDLLYESKKTGRNRISVN